MATRCLVIGLDCVPPALAFDRLRAALPNLTALVARGAHGPMRSTVPPITVPAWVSMTTGRDPGELGLYGFRQRRRGTYDLALSDARDAPAPRLWDVLGGAGHRVAALYVPMTSPPRPVNGVLVSGLLSPGPDAPHTHPPGLGDVLRARFGPHRPDVDEFRTDDLGHVLDQLYATTKLHFDVAHHVWTEERPAFQMLVEMGTDRLHHAAWRHLDPEHPGHDPADPAVREVRDYYAFVDAQIGRLLAVAPAANVLVVSDHGARRFEGAVRINEWLRRRGWLALRVEPTEPAALRPVDVDWSRTRAWAAGGYYARVFLNVKGREPDGVVEPEARAATASALAQELAAMEGPFAVDVRRPEAIYGEVVGLAPDLLVVFGDLAYRGLGQVGGDVLTAENDRGPDGCNHDWEGIYVAAGPGISARGRLDGLTLFDVAPTVLGLFGVAPPAGWRGRDRRAG
ncbi:MAG: alkaline phosphatase family protein [Sandaracinaceae bacterium]